MLISRRCDEEIVFPGVGITIKVLKSTESRVRLAIDAPSHIDVLRREIMGRTDLSTASHKLRNELNAVNLAIELYNQLVQRGQLDQAHQTYLKMITNLKRIDSGYSSIEQQQVSVEEGPRVLVVEDDENERELLAVLLRLEGCAVDTATDGADAIDHISFAPRPDIVLLDMKMPGIDGPRTLELIRESPSFQDLTVFGISGTGATEMGVTIGTRRGVDAWFEKPLNPNRLVEAIRGRAATRAACRNPGA